MKTISFINIKGGVAKTTSAIAFATLLAYEHNKRVLLLDCDKQGNATTALIKHDKITGLTTADLLLDKNIDVKNAITNTYYEVDLIPADFNLLEANRKVLFETTSREFRLKRHLERISDKYDYCIIDCPPDVNIGVTNALAASDYVLIPIRADSYGFNGLNYTFDAVQEAQEINPNLKIAGCFLTMLQSNTLLAIRRTKKSYKPSCQPKKEKISAPRHNATRYIFSPLGWVLKGACDAPLPLAFSVDNVSTFCNFFST